MFINHKTGRPAWLVSQDLDATYSLAADRGHPHHTVPAHEFFAGHREATADEITEHTPRPAPAPKPAAPKSQAPKFKAPAPKAKGGKGGVRKAPAVRSSPARAKPPAAAQAAPPPSPPNHGGGGGEPRGE